MTDFTSAIEQATRIRALYHQLEKRHHGSEWSVQEDMIGFTSDVGELGKWIMGTDGRWGPPGDAAQELPGKLAECLWWLLSFSDRLGIDLNDAFQAKITELETHLTKSIGSED